MTFLFLSLLLYLSSVVYGVVNVSVRYPLALVSNWRISFDLRNASISNLKSPTRLL